MSKGELKKERILEAGLAVMKAQGYNGTSVNDVVAEAGIPKGSFYNYFASKEEFAIEAIKRAAAESYAASEAILKAPGQPPLARLQRFFAEQCEDCCTQDFKVGCFVGNMCQEMADASDAIRLAVDNTLQQQTRLIQSVLDEVQTPAAGQPTGDTATLAEFLFNAWEGALMRMKAAKSRQPLDAFLQQLPRVVQPN